jgi:hypothetical protein
VTAPEAGDVLVFDFGGGDHHVTLFETDNGDGTWTSGRRPEAAVRRGAYYNPRAGVSASWQAVVVCYVTHIPARATACANRSERNQHPAPSYPEPIMLDLDQPFGAQRGRLPS